MQSKTNNKIDIHDYEKSPLFKSLIELNEELIKEDTTPITLNVVGGFALMIHDIRNKSEMTDIDYVGDNLPEKIDQISQKIGIKNGMEKHWINNDIMLSGMNIDDFELSTGKLNFVEAFDLEKIKINVLDTKDLLKLKVIAIDTALSAVDFGGDFTRMKDFRDIMKLSERLNVKIEDLGKIYKENIVNINTVNAIIAYKDRGPEAVTELVEKTQYKFQKEKYENKDYQRTSFIDNIINEAMKKARDCDDR